MLLAVWGDAGMSITVKRVGGLRGLTELSRRLDEKAKAEANTTKAVETSHSGLAKPQPAAKPRLV
jgi:hypothetical protein